MPSINVNIWEFKSYNLIVQQGNATVSPSRTNLKAHQIRSSPETMFLSCHNQNKLTQKSDFFEICPKRLFRPKKLASEQLYKLHCQGETSDDSSLINHSEAYDSRPTAMSPANASG